MERPKTLTLKELRDGGYLQEANRLFFHPLGLALAVVFTDGANHEADEPDGLVVNDCRDDPEGYYFAKARDVIEASRRLEFAGKIETEREAKKETRTALFGSEVQGTDSLIQIAVGSEPAE